MLLYKFLTGKEVSDKILWIGGCLYSYAILSLMHIVGSATGVGVQFGATGNAIVASLIGCLVICIAVPIAQSKWYNWLLLHVFHIYTASDLLSDLPDAAKGSWVSIYPKGKDFYVLGSYHAKEFNGNDSWFSVNNYGMYRRETNEEICDYGDNPNKFFIIRISDIEYVEIENNV